MVKWFSMIIRETFENPGSAEVEKEVTLADGTTKMNVFRLGDIEAKYIRNYQFLSGIDFNQQISN